MGLFSFFKKATKDSIISSDLNIKEVLDSNNVEIEKKKVPIESKEERKNFMKENCDQIMEATKQIEEAKVEYQAVTSYLTDMQKIDMIPVEERESLDDAARKIITFTRERAKYHNSDIKITDAQFKNIERFETVIPDEINRIREEEIYNSAIKNDMRHLEGERGALLYEQEEIVAKQKYLKGLAIITCILVAALLLLFLAISYVFEIDTMIPYIMTITMAALSAFYIFYESRRNNYNIVIVDRKLNRAISLLNKVKIKCVNNTNSLDYAYNKYSVNSAMELEYLWNQYIKAKEEEKRYRKNTEMLNLYNETLVKELKRFKIADPDIWVYQSVAIIDKKEMVEIRHRLNVRRQKLRDRIDYNNKLKETSLSEMKEIIAHKPELKSEVIQMLRTYHIDI